MQVFVMKYNYSIFSIMLIDTHAHLNFKVFNKIIDQVLWQAGEAGVKKIIVPGTDLESSQKAVNLAKHFVNVYAAIGIHPHHVNKEMKQLAIKQLKEKLKELAKNKKVIAIGECGLDYYHYPKTKYDDYKIDDDFRKKQKELFKMQLELARELKLPVIIHNRQAHDDIKKIVQKAMRHAPRAVFHCFEGDEKFLDWVLSKGFYIGFDGNITYDKKLAEIVKLAPIDKILLETDSPFLIPEPLRSRKTFPNEPKNVKITAKYIARLKGDSFFNIAKQTTANAEKLFSF